LSFLAKVVQGSEWDLPYVVTTDETIDIQRSQPMAVHSLFNTCIIRHNSLGNI
jgi:hypothetical protein